ncbi:hypothetical protein IAU60_006199 [Kwoniella sp. DSM 27419]
MSHSFQPAPTPLSNQPTEAVPPSVVAAGTGVPSAPTEHAEPQQANTAPGTGGVVSDGTDKVSFKEQVNGYAKKFAGQVFNNDREKEFGEQKLNGQA